MTVDFDDLGKRKRPRRQQQLESTITLQTQANLTAMMENIKGLTNTISGLQNEIQVARQIAERAALESKDIAEKTVNGLLQSLPEAIEKASETAAAAQAKQVGASIIAQLKAEVGQAQQGQVDQAQGGGSPVVGNPQGNNVIVGLLADLVRKEIGIGGTGGSNNPFGQLTQAAQSMGQFYTAMMEPLARMQNQVRQTTLQELITLERTGGTMPWDRKKSDNGGVSQSAEDMAREIKITP